MKKFILLTVLLCSSMAMAAGPYMGLSGNYIDTDITDHQGATLVVGADFNDYIGIEGRTLITSNSDTYNSVKVEIDELYGFYLKASLPLSDSFSPYLIAGKTWGDVTASYGGYSESASGNDTSFGIGGALALRENWTVTAEYMRVFDDVDSWGLGIRRNF